MKLNRTFMAAFAAAAVAWVGVTQTIYAADIKEIRVPDEAARKAEKAQKASQVAEKASAAQKAQDVAAKDNKAPDEAAQKAEKASKLAEKAEKTGKTPDVKVSDDAVKKAEKANQLADKANASQKAQDADKRSQSASKVVEGAAQKAAERAQKSDLKVAPAVAERVSGAKVVDHSLVDNAGKDPSERTRHDPSASEPVPDLGPKGNLPDRKLGGGSSDAPEGSGGGIDKATGLPTGGGQFSGALGEKGKLRERLAGSLEPAGADHPPGSGASELESEESVDVPEGSLPGNPVNDVASEGIGGPLGNAAANDNKTGRTGKDSSMISDDAAAPATPTGGQQPAQKPAEEPKKEVIELVDSDGKKTIVEMNPDGKTYSYVNADGEKVEAIHSTDGRNYLFTDSDGAKRVVVREQDGSYKTVAEYDKHGNLWYNEGGYMFPPQIFSRPEGERGSAREYMEFLRNNPEIARQLQQAQVGRPASRGGGGDITPSDEPLAAGASVLGEANKRAGVRIQENLVGNPGAQGGLRESGAPRQGPDYGSSSGAGVTDTGGDYTRRGGIQQKEGDFMAKKPTQGLPSASHQSDDKDDKDKNDDQKSGNSSGK